MTPLFQVDNDYSKYWVTKQGDRIKYQDMTNSHLLNTYNMLQGKLVDFYNKCMTINEPLDVPNDVDDAISALESELIKRGLMK